MADETSEEQALRPVPTGNVWADLRAMHAFYGIDSSHMNAKHLEHRLNFLQEELNETRLAASEGDGHDVIDGLIDLVVVAVGTLDMLDVDGQEAWHRVMTANNAKEVGLNSTRPDSGGVDLIKPEGWEAPNLHGIISTVLKDVMNEPPMLNHVPISERESVRVLMEAAEVMRKKSADYVGNSSSISAADYYPNGTLDFVYMIDVLKRNRQTSLLDIIKNGGEINHESLEDTLIDRINYLALWVEWLRGKTPGQPQHRDIFNKPLGEQS